MLSTHSAGVVLHKPWDWMDFSKDGRKEGRTKANSDSVPLKSQEGTKQQAERYIYRDSDLEKMNWGLGRKREHYGNKQSFEGGGFVVI